MSSEHGNQFRSIKSGTSLSGNDDGDDDADGDDEYTNLCNLCAFLLFLFIYSTLSFSFSFLPYLTIPYYHTSQLEAAEKRLQEALEIERGLHMNDTSIESTSLLNNLGVLYRWVGRFKSLLSPSYIVH